MRTVPRCILDEGRERQGRGEEGEGVGWDVGGVVVVVGVTAVAFLMRVPVVGDLNRHIC